MQITTFTYLYSFIKSGMVTNLKEDSLDLLMLYGKKGNKIAGYNESIIEFYYHHYKVVKYMIYNDCM